MRIHPITVERVGSTIVLQEFGRGSERRVTTILDRGIASQIAMLALAWLVDERRWLKFAIEKATGPTKEPE